MKRSLVITILLVLVIGVCIGNMTYVKKTIVQLNNNMEQTIAYAKQNDLETANNSLIKTNELWHQHRKIYAIFIEQDLLDEVDNQMALLKALLLYHEEEFLPQALLCLSHLEEIEQRESISYYSWF